MKRITVVFLFLAICLALFSSCNSTPHKNDEPPTTDNTADTNEEYTCLEGVRIWDWHHPDDSERNRNWIIELASIPNAVFKQENSSVYVNDELLIGGEGYACTSFYTTTLPETNKTLLCFSMSLGSGICIEKIVIIDFETRQEIFTLESATKHDYQLFVRDGILCVREIDYLTREFTRTGTVCYTGADIQIVWDDSLLLDEDRNQSENRQPIS